MSPLSDLQKHGSAKNKAAPVEERQAANHTPADTNNKYGHCRVKTKPFAKKRRAGGGDEIRVSLLDEPLKLSSRPDAALVCAATFFERPR